LVLALVLGEAIGWRNVFLITGGVGVLLALVIWFGVRDAPRGQSEPELAELSEIGIYRFDWRVARGLLRKRTLWPLFAQGFFGVFPWNVITAWFFYYLEEDRAYSSDSVLVTMSIAVLVLAGGYFLGGAAGDFFFKRTPRGRLLVCLVGVISGAMFLALTINVPVAEQGLFLLLLCATALFIPFCSPNVIATVYDITEPEVRSTALAVQYFIENSGAALAPLLTGLLVREAGLTLGNAILVICFTAWMISAVFVLLAFLIVPRDIAALRETMRARAGAAQAGVAGPEG
ncbi:MAG: MFS transporter, partial [Anaerolineae bacterium]|nr:MFS transporter [Anaerolineae bacterium]